jgi:glycosyltransferase involved in cell wall biosynthesis
VEDVAGAAELPGVSYVMPVLNEADYIKTAVASILAQDYPGPTEIVLALGPSSDGTNDIVAGLVQSEPRIRTVDNPHIDIPIGLNRAIRAATHPVIVRVDAHVELPNDYTLRAVTTLLREKAANVGGVMVAVGKPGLQAAVARAYNSRLGLGGGAYHRTDEAPGEAESAYLGVMRADALAEVGYFDESLRRGEDWELNFRLRSAGYRVWLDPSLRVHYWPRNSWKALARQFWATGRWRGELFRRLGLRNSLRYFIPPTLVLATVAALVLAPLSVFGGALAWLALAAAAGPIAYLVMLAGVAVASSGSLRDRGRLCLVLATMHWVWGAGFIVGAVRGAKDTVDTSRHRGLHGRQPNQPSS